MGRRFAEQAEIVGRAHQPLAKMPSPHAIDDNARGERLARIGEPLGEFQPAAFVAVK